MNETNSSPSKNGRCILTVILRFSYRTIHDQDNNQKAHRKCLVSGLEPHHMLQLNTMSKWFVYILWIERKTNKWWKRGLIFGWLHRFGSLWLFWKNHFRYSRVKCIVTYLFDHYSFFVDLISDVLCLVWKTSFFDVWREFHPVFLINFNNASTNNTLEKHDQTVDFHVIVPMNSEAFRFFFLVLVGVKHLCTVFAC